MEQCLIMYIVILYVIISFLGFGGGKLFIWVIRNPARPQTQRAAKDDLEFIIFLPPPSHNWDYRFGRTTPSLGSTGLDPRVSYMLGKHSTSWNTPSRIFYKSEYFISQNKSILWEAIRYVSGAEEQVSL